MRCDLLCGPTRGLYRSRICAPTLSRWVPALGHLPHSEYEQLRSRSVRPWVPDRCWREKPISGCCPTPPQRERSGPQRERSGPPGGRGLAPVARGEWTGRAAHRSPRRMLAGEERTTSPAGKLTLHHRRAWLETGPSPGPYWARVLVEGSARGYHAALVRAQGYRDVHAADVVNPRLVGKYVIGGGAVPDMTLEDEIPRAGDA
jgi:hypothetical protein